MNKYIYITLLAILLSCDKGFEELNQNPNQSMNVNPNYLLSQSLIKGSGQFSTGVHTEIWTLMEWMQMLADLYEPNNPGNFYAYSSGWSEELWKEWYVDALMPIQTLMNNISEDENTNLYQIARIWKVFLFHRITDLWGSIPYSDALMGYTNNTIAPSYDHQEFIYQEMQLELDKAITQIDLATEGPGNADLIFNGNLNQWKKFASVLKLRLAIRISGVKPSQSSGTINALLSFNHLLESNSDNVQINFYTEHLHPFYELEYTGQGMTRPSAYLINVLKDDPRLSFYCEPTPLSQTFGVEEYVGVPNLTNASMMSELNDFNSSSVGTHFLHPNLPSVLFSYAEQCFLLAEASYNGLISGNASEYYRIGIEAHMLQLGVPDELIQNHLSQIDPITLENIHLQKWITFVYTNGYEAFAEKRRTGYPVFDTNDEVQEFPKRFVYPNSEYDLNTQNVTSLGTISVNSPLWWNNY